jgi:hypothetical protein
LLALALLAFALTNPLQDLIRAVVSRAEIDMVEIKQSFMDQ